MPGVFYSPAAEEDLAGIVVFIARDKPEAARRWIQRVREACELLATQPGIGELRPGFGVYGCRSFTVGTYVIFYRESVDGIEIARVIHGSRDLHNL